MEGHLYQLITEDREELYWSFDSQLEDKIANSYLDYEEFVTEETSFEDWFNFNFVAQIKRVFVTEINV